MALSHCDHIGVKWEPGRPGQTHHTMCPSSMPVAGQHTQGQVTLKMSLGWHNVVTLTLMTYLWLQNPNNFRFFFFRSKKQEQVLHEVPPCKRLAWCFPQLLGGRAAAGQQQGSTAPRAFCPTSCLVWEMPSMGHRKSRHGVWYPAGTLYRRSLAVW